MALATRPKTSSYHKKSVGKHHKTTKHYVKAYLPYLPLLSIAAIGMAITSSIHGPGSVLGSRADMSTLSLLEDTNQQRSLKQETGLAINDKLSAAAQAKANDMVLRNYWSHATPDGRQPWSFITAAGYNYRFAGENLAYGFSDAIAVTNGWMSSPDHRANILNADYTDVGFGVASSANYHGSGPETIVVAMYGSPVAPEASNAVSNIRFTVLGGSSEANVLGATKAASVNKVSLVQMLTKGQAPWSVVAVSALGTAALVIFVTRHGKGWHRALKQSEAYIASHPWFDVIIVTIGTLSFILSRTTGFIR